MALRHVNGFYTVRYLVLSLILSAVTGISMDYYYGNVEPLRSASHIVMEKCGTTTMRFDCYEKCGTNHACFLDLCFCVKVRVPEIEEDSDEDLTKEKSRASQEFNEDEEEDYGENIVLSAYAFKLRNDNEDIADEREALRHHIAHFCPNLDIARECIKTCLKLGLPSFCGKNHVCYCGHNYPSSKGNPKGNPKLVKNQFRDLYEKYFGKKIRNRRKRVRRRT